MCHGNLTLSFKAVWDIIAAKCPENPGVIGCYTTLEGLS